MFLFIVFPLSLTLNNTFPSLDHNYYLGTLKWNTMKIKWKFYEKTYLIFHKKIIIIGFHDQFSLMWKLVVDSQFM
jgi:hypothetical protein